MPGTGTVGKANLPLTPLVLSVAEDTYTITFDRTFPGDAPCLLRISTDTASLLISTVTGGPYHFNPSTWPMLLPVTPGTIGSTIVLYVKAVSGTPSLYIMPVNLGAS